MAWARKKGLWVKSLDFNMERKASRNLALFPITLSPHSRFLQSLEVLDLMI